jgi:hypothetical protein
MTDRYDARGLLINKHPLHKKLLDARGRKFIQQYDTPSFRALTETDYGRVKKIGHTWNFGDRYYKLSYDYYGDPSVWWLIAWFNQRPTEADLKIGDPIYIPVPLERALNLYYG